MCSLCFPPSLSFSPLSRQSDQHTPIPRPRACLPGLVKIKANAKELGAEPAPQAGPVSVPGCRWMKLGAGQPLALSCPATPGSCLAVLGLFSFSF